MMNKPQMLEIFAYSATFLLIRCFLQLFLLQQSQLGNAVLSEDYEDAARLKVAIAAAATNDTVGRVMSNLSVRSKNDFACTYLCFLFIFWYFLQIVIFLTDYY